MHMTNTIVNHATVLSPAYLYHAEVKKIIRERNRKEESWVSNNIAVFSQIMISPMCINVKGCKKASDGLPSFDTSWEYELWNVMMG